MSDTNENAPAAPAAAPAPRAPAQQPSLFQQPAAQPVINVAPSVSAQALDEIAAARKMAEQEAAARKALEAKLAEFEATAAKLTEQVGLSARQAAELAAQRRAEAIRNAAAMAAVKHGAISETQLVKLVLDELDEVDGAVVSKADPKVSAEDHVAAYLKANPHLAKPKVATGSGATGFAGAAPAAGAPTFDLRTAEGLTQYARYLTYPRGQAPSPVPGTPAAKPGA
ncbi:MAG TPA: hypothetical protein VIU16_14335 [Gaiellaceae bacterium]